MRSPLDEEAAAGQPPCPRGVLHAGGEVELYDLEQDPDELASAHLDPANASVHAGLAARLRELNTAWTQPIP